MNEKLIKHIQNFKGVIEVNPVYSDDMTTTLVEIVFNEDETDERLDPEEVAIRNYQATERRGQINDKTTIQGFIDKIFEEANELDVSHFKSKLKTFDPEELADISIVCDCMAIHFGIDLQLEKQKKMLINESRTD